MDVYKDMIATPASCGSGTRAVTTLDNGLMKFLDEAWCLVFGVSISGSGNDLGMVHGP